MYENKWRLVDNILPLPEVTPAVLVPLVPGATKGVCAVHCVCYFMGGNTSIKTLPTYLNHTQIRSYT